MLTQGHLTTVESRLKNQSEECDLSNRGKAGCDVRQPKVKIPLPKSGRVQIEQFGEFHTSAWYSTISRDLSKFVIRLDDTELTSGPSIRSLSAAMPAIIDSSHRRLIRRGQP